MAHAERWFLAGVLFLVFGSCVQAAPEHVHNRQSAYAFLEQTMVSLRLWNAKDSWRVQSPDAWGAFRVYSRWKADPTPQNPGRKSVDLLVLVFGDTPKPSLDCVVVAARDDAQARPIWEFFRRNPAAEGLDDNLVYAFGVDIKATPANSGGANRVPVVAGFLKALVAVGQAAQSAGVQVEVANESGVPAGWVALAVNSDREPLVLAVSLCAHAQKPLLVDWAPPSSEQRFRSLPAGTLQALAEHDGSPLLSLGREGLAYRGSEPGKYMLRRRLVPLRSPEGTAEIQPPWHVATVSAPPAWLRTTGGLPVGLARFDPTSRDKLVALAVCASSVWQIDEGVPVHPCVWLFATPAPPRRP